MPPTDMGGKILFLNYRQPNFNKPFFFFIFRKPVINRNLGRVCNFKIICGQPLGYNSFSYIKIVLNGIRLIFGCKYGVSLFWNRDIVFEDMDEDENDENFEKYYSFVFRSISVTGNPPISVSGDNLFLVNYRNFPKSIKLNGENNVRA